MSQINIRLDETLKTQAEILFSEMGMNMTTAINLFIRQAVRERAIPFKIDVNPIADDFTIEEKKIIEDGLRQSLADIKAGRVSDSESWLNSKRSQLEAKLNV